MMERQLKRVKKEEGDSNEIEKILQRLNEEPQSECKVSCLLTQILSIEFTNQQVYKNGVIESLLDVITSKRLNSLQINASKALLRVNGGVFDANANVCAFLSSEISKHSVSNSKIRLNALESLLILCPPLVIPFVPQLYTDLNPQIRFFAFNSTIKLFETLKTSLQNTPKSKLELFSITTNALLADSSEIVRLETVKLLSLISSAFPNEILQIPQHKPSKQPKQVKIIDEIFLRLCNSIVSDNSPLVRSKACEFLAQNHFITFISPLLLSQSLTKCPLTTNSTNLSLKEDTLPSKSLPTGDIDISKGDFLITSIESIASGAFVHALEDEFSIVRESAISSLEFLATKTTKNQIGEESINRILDFFGDMLNDQMDSVRSKAVKALHSVSILNPMNSNLLHSVLSTLEDQSIKVRKSVHFLLSDCKLIDKQSLFAVILALLSNLKRNPIDDKISILESLSKIGKLNWNFFFNLEPMTINENLEGKNDFNFKDFNLSFVNEILCVDSRFDIIESHPDDLIYNGRLCCILNAISQIPQNHFPKIQQSKQIPQFIKFHSIYLHEKYPKIFPFINFEEENGSQSTVTLMELEFSNEIEQLFENALKFCYGNEIKTLIKLNKINEVLKLLNSYSNDIQRSMLLSASTSNSNVVEKEFHFQFIEIIKMFISLFKNKNENNCFKVRKIVNQIISHSYGLEKIHFKNVPLNTIFELRFLRSFSQLKLLLLLSSNSSSCREISIADLLFQFESLQTLYQNSKTEPPQLLLSCINSLQLLLNSSNSSTISIDLFKLPEIFKSYFPSCPLRFRNRSSNSLDDSFPSASLQNNSSQSLQKVKVEIISPETNPESPKEFLNSLPLTIQLKLQTFGLNKNGDLPNLLINVFVNSQNDGSFYFPVLNSQIVEENEKEQQMMIVISLKLPLLLNLLQTNQISLITINVLQTFDPNPQKTTKFTLPLCKPLLFYVTPKSKL